MEKMERVLYATDFSENAEKAFPFALRIARAHRAELIMLHVFDIPTSWNYPHAKNALDMESQAIKESKDKLRNLFDKYAADVKAKFIAVEDTSIASAVDSVTREKGPGLIVIGTKGGSIIKEFIVGSATRALVKRSTVPVLSIPEHAADRDFKQVIFTSDLYEQDIAALQRLIEFMQPFKPQISVVHVTTDKEYRADEKMEWFRNLVEEQVTYDRITFDLLFGEDIYDRLNEFMGQNEFDLLVMFEKERHGVVDALLHTNLVKKMEFNSSIPLLSFNENYIRAKQNEDRKEDSRKELQNK